jgi:hypothetical protein
MTKRKACDDSNEGKTKKKKEEPREARERRTRGAANTTEPPPPRPRPREATEAQEPPPPPPGSGAPILVRTAGGRSATVIQRLGRGWFVVDLDGNENDEGKAFERKNIRRPHGFAPYR